MLEKINNNNFHIVSYSNQYFDSFYPYVASISNNSVISFQASLKENKSGIFISEKNNINCLVQSDKCFNNFFSHPDINENKLVTFYAEKNDKTQGVFCFENYDIYTVFEIKFDSNNYIGPLGPTINEKGIVAFRATVDNIASIFIGEKNKSELIASTKNIFNNFHGIPVINDFNQVIFRTTLKNGLDAIYLYQDSKLTCIVDTSNDFISIGYFPSINNLGQIIFSGELKNGEKSIFLYQDKTIKKIISDEIFESFRGGIINNKGDIIFYATIIGKKLGIFVYKNDEVKEIATFEEKMLDFKVVDLALNAVSLNDKGEVVLRIKDEKGIHRIVVVNTSI